MPSAAPKRPGIVLGAAIMLFISGGFALLGILGAVQPYLVAMGPAPPPPMPGQPNFPDPTREIVQTEPVVMGVMTGFAVLNAIFGAVKIWVGIGVLKLRPPARKGGIIVSIIAILLTIGENAFGALVYFPIFLRIMFRDMPREMAGLGSFVEIMIWFAVGISVIIAMAYWFTVIVMLSSQRAKDAFAGISDEPDHEPRERDRDRDRGYGGYDDDDDDGYPRRSAPPDTGITDRS